MSQDDMFQELLTDFLDESDQLLVRLSQDLLTLDELVAACAGDRIGERNLELLNTIFRSAHSLKGLSAMLGLSNINQLTHRLENVFDAARKDELILTRPVMEIVFQSHDALSAMIERLRTEGTDEYEVSALVEDITALLDHNGHAKQASTQADAEVALAALAQLEARVEEAVQPQPAAVVASSGCEIADGEVDFAAVQSEVEEIFFAARDESEVSAKYLSIFIDETDLTLDEIFDCLLDAESARTTECGQEMLISFHRIKGAAASIGLNSPARLAHLVEDMLQRLNEAKATLSIAQVDAISCCADALRTYVTGLKNGKRDGSNFCYAAVKLLVASRSTSVNVKPAAAPSPATTNSDWIQPIAAMALDHEQVFAIRIELDPRHALPAMKARLLYEKLTRFGEVFFSNPDSETLEQIDDLSQFLVGVATTATAEKLRPQLMLAGVNDVQIVQIAGASGIVEVPPSPAKAAPVAAAPIAPPKPVEPAAKKSPDIPAPPPARSAEEAAPPAAASTSADASRPGETLRVDIERLDQLMNLAGQLVINKARFAQLGDAMRSALPSKQAVHRLQNVTVSTTSLLKSLDSSIDDTTVEVDQLRQQVRRLQAELMHVRDEFHRVGELRVKLNEFQEAVHQFDRVVDGIQRSVMDTRMVPIGPLFQRFKRVIRDITRANGKDIRLEIHGEKTELDKRMIDELGDPLIHMVRNSADHGVESPDDRVAAGKSRQGTITLDAFHRGNSIVITVKDDGKGLAREKILAKAIERGLITSADAERLTPHQIHQLIWEPGFSTAEKITEISGRGMGMDIVRSKIESLNGTVEVESTPGEGTTFIIKLPLTLAILPSLMSVIDGDVFALPIESIVEIVSINRSQLTSIHGQIATTIRGRVVSVVKLTDLFSWCHPPRTTMQASDDSTLVVITHEGREIGLIVDHVIGEEDVVIKSLAENYRNVAGVAGASILGDGRVSLILDVGALVEMASKSTPTADA